MTHRLLSRPAHATGANGVPRSVLDALGGGVLPITNLSGDPAGLRTRVALGGVCFVGNWVSVYRAKQCCPAHACDCVSMVYPRVLLVANLEYTVAA